MRRRRRPEDTVTNVKYADLEIIDFHKPQRAKELFESGLMMMFTDPLSLGRIESWCDHFKKTGSPYLLVSYPFCRHGDAIILKERRDFRCTRCGSFIRLKHIKDYRRCEKYPKCDLMMPE